MLTRTSPAALPVAEVEGAEAVLLDAAPVAVVLASPVFSLSLPLEETAVVAAVVAAAAGAVFRLVVATATLVVEDGYCLSRAHQVSRSPMADANYGENDVLV